MKKTRVQAETEAETETQPPYTIFIRDFCRKHCNEYKRKWYLRPLPQGLRERLAKPPCNKLLYCMLQFISYESACRIQEQASREGYEKFNHGFYG